MRFTLIVFLGVAVTALSNAEITISLAELSDSAVQRSKLDLRGSRPFHLKASIVETANPSSEFRAEVEEYWESPKKYKRTIKSPQFSQTLIVNGDAISETNTNNYFPIWLNHLVSNIFDPLPMLPALRQTTMMMEKPRNIRTGPTCADLRFKVDRWLICFDPEFGRVSSVTTKGSFTEFKEYKNFGSKRIARRITSRPEPGITIEARITELNELGRPNQGMFAVQLATPENDRIQSVKIDEDAFRELAINSTDIHWPPTRGGLATGQCAVYVSADRDGQVREVLPAGCDNPDLENPLREAVKKWVLRPATSNGKKIQVETLLSFMFHTDVSAENQPGVSSHM